MVSEYIYGLHEGYTEDALQMYRNAGVTGWIVFTEAIGRDPNDQHGHDYREWEDQGLGIIVRLNHGYNPNGTIPLPEYYDDFATRCGNFVANSPGCHRWIIGNEPNHEVERPHGELITYENYALCYAMCRDEIRDRPGHGGDEVLVACTAPWNLQGGDWLNYFEEVLLLADEYGGVDGIALHAYTHGADAQLPFSTEQRHGWYWHLKVYYDFIKRIPPELRDVPLYITECGQNDEWLNINSGWVKNAYKEIDNWNKMAGTQKIHCLCLYRWPHFDKYRLVDKDNVQQDFREALREGYKWTSGGDMTTILDGFEGGFYDYQGVGELTCPKGWAPQWDTHLVRPEYDAKYDTPEVRTGHYAANFFHVHNTFDAVLWREFKVGTGVPVEAAIWAMGVSNDGSGNLGGLGMQIGIDPAGGHDFLAGSVEWGDWIALRKDEQEERVWYQLQASAVSASDKVTVFLRGKADWPVDINATHWDDFVLKYEDDGEPPPPPDGSDADTLRLYADTLESIADGIRTIADRMAGGCDPYAKAKVADAKALLEEALSLM